MKKTYINPSVKIYKVTPTRILDGSQQNLNYGGRGNFTPEANDRFDYDEKWEDTLF